jgi:carbamoyl-phosphate synthase large subunit
MTGTSTQASRIVLVTGVGAIIGQGIVRSLRQCHKTIRVIGLDRNKNSLGPFICDAFYAKPACDESSSEYLAFWHEILRKESVDLVLPGLEIDLFFLNAHRQVFSGSSTKLGLNRSELIELARDKWLLGEALPSAGIDPIPTVLSRDWNECVNALGAPPFLIKPRQGNGSRGIVRVSNHVDFDYWMSKSDGNLMTQKIIGQDAEEFTAGAFGLGNGSSLSPIIFRRLLSPAGNTQYAEVVTDSAIELATQKLARYFKPIGPTNYQFRKENGMPYLLEINPRLSSSSSLRAGFGYNEAEMAIDFYLNDILPQMPEVKPGRAWRYSEDFYIK